MTDEHALVETAKALGVAAVLPAVYRDLLSPAAKELGQGLATVAKSVRIALAPVEGAVWCYDRIREWLSVRVTRLLADRRAEDIQAPPLSVAGPLVIQMVFASEQPELRELYARLLATSMDAHTAALAHPSFVNIIQQLTPDEARILQHLERLGRPWPSWSGDQQSHELRDALRKMCADAGVSHPSLADVYIDNLLRLGILHRTSGTDTEFFPEQVSHYGDTAADVVTTNWDLVELSAFGRALLDACVADHPGASAATRKESPETR